MAIFLGSNRLTSTGGSGGGGGSLTNTYAAFHVSPSGVFASLTFTALSGNGSGGGPDPAALNELGLTGAGSNATVGIFMEDGTLLDGSVSLIRDDAAGNFRAGYDGTWNNPMVGTFLIVPGAQTSDIFVTEGYNEETGLYEHPEGGVYLRTGTQILQGSTYPNATVTGTQDTLLPVNTFPGSLNESLIRWKHDGTNLWRFVWADTDGSTFRSEMNFNTGGNASIVATPFTVTGTGADTTYTAGADVTVVAAGSAGPFTFVGSLTQSKIYDVAWDPANSQWIWFTASTNETGQIRIQNTDTDFGNRTIFQVVNIAAPASTSGSFNLVETQDHSISVAPLTGDWNILARSGRNINALGIHYVDVSNSHSVSFGGNSIGHNASIQFDTDGHGYVLDHTLAQGGIDRSAAVIASGVNPSSYSIFYSVPSTVVPTTTIPPVDGTHQIVTDHNDRFWIPINGQGINAVLEIADIINNDTNDFHAFEPLVGDGTPRSIVDNNLTPSDILGQTVFYKIG